MTIFISGDRPNVAGLVLAGSADFKTELSQSDMFDQRLQAAVLAVVDVSYGASPPGSPSLLACPSRGCSASAARRQSMRGMIQAVVSQRARRPGEACAPQQATCTQCCSMIQAVVSQYARKPGEACAP